MNRSNFAKWARRTVLTVMFALANIGCNPLNLAGFIFGGNEKVPAPYPLAFKDGPKKDKDEIVVVLLPHITQNNNQSFFSTERELAAELARVLPEMAKENKNKKKLRVVSPLQVDKFKKDNPDWKTMNAVEIGQKLNADFVLDIELSKVRLYQPNTGGERIYEGRADVSVTIYEIDGANSKQRDNYPLSYSYPKGTYRDGSAISESQFKKEYIEQLAVEISERHVDHRNMIGGNSGVGR